MLSTDNNAIVNIFQIICYFKKLSALGVGPIADYFLIKRLATANSVHVVLR